MDPKFVSPLIAHGWLHFITSSSLILKLSTRRQVGGDSVLLWHSGGLDIGYFYQNLISIMEIFDALSKYEIILNIIIVVCLDQLECSFIEVRELYRIV